MKAYTIVAAGLFLVSLPAMGQSYRPAKQSDTPHFVAQSYYTDAYIRKALETYEMTLNSTNDGIVESTLAYVTYMRLNMPKADFKEIGGAIFRLAESGRTPVIRYKAYLATVVFESPASFSSAQDADYTDSNLFFSDVSLQAQKTLLGQNIK